MRDLHSHILPGLDDGVRTIAAAVELARAAAADGVRTIAATPHVRDDYPTTPEQMEGALAEVRAAVRGAGVPVDVVGGGEIAIDRLSSLSHDDLLRFSLGGGERYVLLEFPYRGWPVGIERLLHSLAGAGLGVVLAHPERSPQVAADPSGLRPALDQGALLQVTAASLDGRLGRGPADTAQRLLELGWVHLLASDAHAPEVREVGFAAAVAAVGDEALAAYLCEEAPAAILAGERPAEPRRLARRKRGLGARFRFGATRHNG